MTNYTELKRLAEAAESFKPTNLDLINPNYMAKAKAAHIAFADKAPPHVTLSMIAEIDRLRTQNQALVEALEAVLSESHDGPLHDDYRKKARAALAQAEGWV